jgi:hypothetical protein
MSFETCNNPHLRFAVPWIGPWPLIPEARIRARVNPCGICGGQRGTETGFFFQFFNFPLSVSFHRGSILLYHLGDE